MCGIAGIVLKNTGGSSNNLAENIRTMTGTLRHRGPDGEGFILATESAVVPYFDSEKTSYSRTDLSYIPLSPLTHVSNAFLAFGHRRLNIIDLSEAGHQPMCSGACWINFNGEIYNYIELREELRAKGYSFSSDCDTEVALIAYRAWGTACVNRFNGMWSFCIYDSEKQLCFASRDRLGVKPFYYIHTPAMFAFASEQKAFTGAALVKPQINPEALGEYLLNSRLENSSTNFFEGITELWPGQNLLYDIKKGDVTTHIYFHLSDQVNNLNNDLSEKVLIEKIRTAFVHSVKMRLRSDVEVGTCLSGGIDSSALAVTIAEFTRHPLNCFTSVFPEKKFNEEHFANLVAASINGNHFKVQPTLEGFMKEVDNLVYSQDVPIWDTSTYAQFKVMALAKDHGIKVVLDGQGADELFAGYHHHFTARWNDMLNNGSFSSLISDLNASKKTFPSPFSFYLKERMKMAFNFNHRKLAFLFKDDFIAASPVRNSLYYFNDVNSQLIDDIYNTRLKSFLKCEDRCGMWHSVESRTPFSDDPDLMNLAFSFDGNKKIKNGISKYLLREAVKDKLPPQIYARYDKKGFETPMQEWMVKMRPMILDEIRDMNFPFVRLENISKTDPASVFQNKILFRLFIISRWYKVFTT